MAIGKNKRVTKGKKGGRARPVDPFLKKEWYHLKAPSMFQTRDFGLTLANKSQGTKLAVDSLKGRVFEVNLADLQDGDEDQSFRKIKLCCEDVQGKNCLTDFHGMDMTRDRLCRFIRKGFSLIEAQADVKTIDGYHLRIFCIAFTDRSQQQVKSTCYAQTSKIKMIRKKMVEIMISESSKVPLRDLVKKFIAESIGREIEQKCRPIFPLKDVYVRKVKVLRKPKFDITKIMELHQEGIKEETGESVPGATNEGDAQNLLTQELVA